MRARIQTSRGILNPKAAERKFQISRHAPADDLAFFVQRYWIVSWDVAGDGPYEQELLPYPCVNLVLERSRSAIFGVVTGKSSRLLEGRGRAFGIKFRPGGFYPFVKSSVARLTNRAIGLGDAFGEAGAALAEAVLSREDDDPMIEVAERFLRERLPERDENLAVIHRIVDRIIADRTITTVDDLAKQFHINTRTLQRIFSQYVGVSPKWVIARYRLQEAAERLENHRVIDWAKLALDLGYCDQAHFIKDFKAIVGKTPAEYARSLG